MSGRQIWPAVAFVTLIVLAGHSSNTRLEAEDVCQSNLDFLDPVLVKRAAESGIYDREELPIYMGMNPYFIRGDFNGDGEIDVAFWVQEKESELRGVAIIHSTLDTLYVFGAGRPRPTGGSQGNQVWVNAWHLLPVGHIEEHPWSDVPEIGAVTGRPFTFERETLQFHHLGKSVFVFYWARGQYWEFWTAD